MTNTANGRQQALVTGPDGRYRAVALQPGPYEVAAELQGFATVRRTITLVVGADATLDLTLGLAALAETVNVTGQAPLVEANRSQPSSVITGAQLQALPVLSRDFLVLAQLLPGAAPISRLSETAPRNGTTKFGGGADQKYAYTTQIDGGDVDDAIWGNPTISLGQDAIAEFKVFRNQFDAQYGKGTSAVVTVVTKSGTNQMAGSGYYFGRDQGLNARNAYARDVPPFQQTRIGYSFGGPLAINRTHFFTAYEGLYRDTADIVALPTTNPFAAQENGTYPREIRRRNFTGRVDHRFNDQHNAYVRYAYDFYGNIAPDKPLRTIDGTLSLGSSDFNDFSRSHSVVVEENWILGSNRVNNFRAHVLVHELSAPAVFEGQRVIRPSFTWGQHNLSPQVFPRKRLTLNEAFLLSVGRHDLNIGGEFEYGHNSFDSHQLEGGQWTFQTDLPFDRNNPATYPFQFTIRERGVYEHNGGRIGAYISDTYRVHQRWTLNLGLRWDFDTNLKDNELIDQMLADPRFVGLDHFVSSGSTRGRQYDAFQPRLGATWDIRGNGTLVARGGYGVYVARSREWLSLGNTQQTSLGNTVLITDRAKQGACYPSISCVLDGKSISDYLATNGAGTRQIAVIPDDMRFPYQRTATAGVGWQLTSTTGLDVDYVHAYAVGQAAEDVNLPASGAITAANPRPVSTLGRVSLAGMPLTKSWYDAMEMQVRQRVRGGNSLQVSYTLSRALIDGCFAGNCAGTLRAFARESLALLERTGRSLEYGYNSLDTRHNLTISASVALPAGVQLSGIGRIVSASPIGITCGCDLDGDGVNDRPRSTPPTVGRGDLDAQLAAINAYRATLNLAPFTLDRIKVLPAAKNVDIRLTKQFAVGSTRRIEVFAEGFNVTNVVNPHTPGTDVRLNTFNVPTGAQDARQIQWGARYSF